jgi:HD-GYP domain-containing protein (c-di-GMP phosphodiesterase class II)
MHADKSGSASARLVKVPADRLTLGAYVAALDRPWLESPFAVQGFYVSTNADLCALRELCQYVYVDPRHVDRLAPHVSVRRSSLGEQQWPPSVAGPHAAPAYCDTVSMRDEFHAAAHALPQATEDIARVFEQLQQRKQLDVAAISQAIQPIIGSVLRNQDAMAALVRIQRKDDYTYSHSIACAVWATVLGRHLGFNPGELHLLALGCALLDVGKAAIPQRLLSKPGPLSTLEMKLMRLHVAESVKLLQRSSDLDRRVLEIVAAHHERHDGSGYPRGIGGSQIPLGARIAGLVDSYDAMITARPYAAPRSSFEAMQELARVKGSAFQDELVEQLMQAIGLFPTGSLVELDTGEVAIIVGQNPSRRLKPKVLIVLDANKQRCTEYPIVDLLDPGGSSCPRRIARELPPGAYGIDAQDYYL